MPKCSVKKCKNNTLTTLKKDGVSYFRFPKNDIEREKWRKIIANERGEESFKPNDSSVVCSSHFSENDTYCTNKGYRKYNKGALPRIETDMETSQHVAAPTTSKLCCDKYNLLENNAQTESQPEDATEGLIKQLSPPPTSSESGVTLTSDTPEILYYKKALGIFHKRVDNKNKLIQNLKKKNKRLMKRNMKFKEVITNLKKKRRVDDVFSNDLTKNINDSNTKVMNILTAKKKVSFAKYPPELRKFALTLQFHSPAAYKYLRDGFAKNLPHPNTLLRWYQGVNAQPGSTEEDPSTS